MKCRFSVESFKYAPLKNRNKVKVAHTSQETSLKSIRAFVIKFWYGIYWQLQCISHCHHAFTTVHTIAQLDDIFDLYLSIPNPSAGFLSADMCPYHCADVWHSLSNGVLLLWAGCSLPHSAGGQPCHPRSTGEGEIFFSAIILASFPSSPMCEH